MNENMKTAKLLPTIFAAFLLVILSSCQSMDNPMGKDLLDNLKVRSSVEDNTFITNFPDVKIKVNLEMQYLGTVRLDKNFKNDMSTRSTEVKDSPFNASSYVFGQFNEGKRLVKAVVIRTILVRGDPNQVIEDIYLGTKMPLDSGKMKILEEEYHYNLFAQQYFFMEEEKDLIKASSLPSCYLVKKIENRTGLGSKSRLQIYYLEASGLTRCNELNPATFTEQQKQVVQGFTERSFQNIRFMQTPKQTVDTTSRYVDQEQGKPVQNPAPDKTQIMEEKLKTLKDLHDKNLITDEEFNKKKAEILKDL
jgi:hypothetical protein